MKNFGMFIPTDITRWPTGEPVRFIQHKRAWVSSLTEAEITELEALPGPKREEAYFKWLADNPQPDPKKWIVTDNPNGTKTAELK